MSGRPRKDEAHRHGAGDGPCLACQGRAHRKAIKQPAPAPQPVFLLGDPEGWERTEQPASKSKGRTSPAQYWCWSCGKKVTKQRSHVVEFRRLCGPCFKKATPDDMRVRTCARCKAQKSSQNVRRNLMLGINLCRACRHELRRTGKLDDLERE